jgi:serine/threonine protein kinase
MAENTWQSSSQSRLIYKNNSLESTQNSTPKKQLLSAIPFIGEDSLDEKSNFHGHINCSEQETPFPTKVQQIQVEHQKALAARALVQAICFDQAEAVNMMLEQYKYDTILQVDKNRTVLMFGVLRENTHILNALLQKWPHLLNVQDDFGLTALTYCIQFSKLKSAAWLLNQGCDLEVCDDDGRTPLHLCAILSRLELFLLIKSRGASLISMDSFGKYPHEYLSQSSLRLAIQKEISTELLDENRYTRSKYYSRLGLGKKSPSIQDGPISQRGAEHYHDRFSEQALKRLMQERIDADTGPRSTKTFCNKYSQKALLARRRQFHISLKPCLLEAKDFVVEHVLGVGENNPHAISHSYCVRYRWDCLHLHTTGHPKYIVVKEYSKRLMLSRDRLKYLQLEKKALMNFHHPFILKLLSCFQSEEKIYLATEFCQKGDLGHVLKNRILSIAEAQILAAELILALECLHQQGFSHRDLKPENVLIGADGHVRMADFGLCHQKNNKNRNLSNKIAKVYQKPTQINQEPDLTSTICGTLVYLPPEVLSHKKYKASAADWYLLGEILYEAVVGYPPFIDDRKEEIKNNILQARLRFPDNCANSSFRNLVANLLKSNPSERLGYHQGAEEIKIHPFFLGVDFEQVYAKQVQLFDPTMLPDIDIKGLGVPLHRATQKLHPVLCKEVLRELDTRSVSIAGLSVGSDTDSESEEQERDFLELIGWSFVK